MYGFKLYVFCDLDVDKNLFLQVVKLKPQQVLTKEMFWNTRRIGISLASSKNLNDLFVYYKTVVDPNLKDIPLSDMMLYNSQNLVSFNSTSMKLSELPDDVGSISNPLVLTYVDRSITGLLYALVVLVLFLYCFIFSNIDVIEWLVYNVCRYPKACEDCEIIS